VTLSSIDSATPPIAEADQSVAVAIATYNHAHYLAEAIASALDQTVAPNEVIVVDDGSSDDPQSVVSQFPGVVYIRQANAGLSAARNTGLQAARSRFIIFLDADDRLLPEAVATGLACMAAHPGAGFVYGGHHRIDPSGNIIGGQRYTPVGDDPYADFLRSNPIGMHATVLYDRQKLLAEGGFDTTYRRCEDYDLYLRMSRDNRVASHPAIIADYRWHDANMSHNRQSMLDWTLRALNRQNPTSQVHQAAQGEGRRNWTNYYASVRLDDAKREAGLPNKAKGAAAAMRMSPTLVGRRLGKAGARRVFQALPYFAQVGAARLLGRPRPPRKGKPSFGDLNSLTPLSRMFGYDRGTPVDRHYIETFLDQNRSRIEGRVLEIGDDTYSKRFGGDQIRQQDILHVHAGNPIATIIGDMSEPGVLPANAFDCMVLTQTLHLIYDLPNVVDRIHTALKPGGVALITVPGITPIDRDEWKSTWYWSLTRYSLSRLLGERFGNDNVDLTTFGNVYTATAFIQGAAVEELDPAKLQAVDEPYVIVVAAVVRKALA
jgi:GT2 family glycosyltransferase/SAM-dependent methyltransferase